MTFKTHNDAAIRIDGTGLMAQITCSYNTLVALFGEPTEADGYKSDAEWAVQFDDGTVATIYNWKNGFNYCGPDHGTPVAEITEWNVGGRSIKAYHHVFDTVKSLRGA